MVINHKIKRSIMESKAQYFGSLALIVISCLLYTLLNQLSANMDALTSSFENDYIQEDASFITDKKIENIQQLESKFNISIEEGGFFDYAVSKEKTLRIFAETTKVNLYAVIQGAPLSGNDLLIDPAYAKANAIEIGDSFLIDNKSFKIAGYMSLPNYIYPLKKETDLLNDPNHFGIAVMGRNDFEEYQQGSRFYSLKVRDTSDGLADKISEIKDNLRRDDIVILKWTNISENPRVTLVTTKMDSMKTIGSVLPMVILLLTCILVSIVMRRMLRREAVVIGTLYAQGYRKTEIMKHYLMYPFVIATAGSIAGTALGAAALKPMLDFMVSYFNMPIDSISFNVAHLAVGLLLPFILLLGSVYFVIRKILTYSPIELMRGGTEKRKVGFIERRLKLNKLKFATKFKIREQLRSIPRSVFLLVGVALATMLLLLGFTIKSSLDFLMKDTYEQAYKYQHEYVFNSLQQEVPADGEVFSVAPFSQHSDDNKSFIIYGVNPDSASLSFKDKSGKPLHFDQVIVTKPLAERLQIKAHDTIELTGKLDGRTYGIMVHDIADSYIGEYIYMPLAAFNDMLGYPAGSYMGIWSDKALSLPGDKLLSESTVDELKQAFDSMTQPIQATFGIVSLMSFIIGLIVIYVVTSLIIEENKENISLLKVLGYQKKEVYSLILNSSTLIVVLGYILGVPLLLVFMKALYRSIAESSSFILPVTMNYAYLAAGFIVIYLIFELTKALSKKKINRISMTEALKSRGE